MLPLILRTSLSQRRWSLLKATCVVSGNQVRNKASMPLLAPKDVVASSETEEPEMASLSKEERQKNRQEEHAQALFNGLNPTLRKNLQSMGINNLFPVQEQTLDICRAGEDVVVRSKTGSGKTIAFAIPTLEKLLSFSPNKSGRGAPKAIIMAPTRELALQVHREFEKLAPSLNSVAVYGGAPVSNQEFQLRKPVDIVIGTPGRIKDFIDRGTLNLENIQVAILDEADEMLKVGFYDSIIEIYSSMPEKSQRQNLLFSATISKEVRRICEEFLNKPKFIDLVGNDTSKIPDTVEMCMTAVTSDSKEAALHAILSAHITATTKENPKRALVFCATKRECEELSRAFHSPDSSLVAGTLHGDMTQAAREHILSKFRDGSCLVLVATDVAARGLDIPEVDLVVHYSLPRDQDSFVHRSGRTGRAGRKGMSILLYDPKYEVGSIRDFENFVGGKFAKRAIPCGPEVVAIKAQDFLDKLTKSGTLVNWLKPTADALRAQDAIDGNDSLAACLASLLGGNTKLKVFSALNGRVGNQTIKVSKNAGKIELDEINSFLKSLPIALDNPKIANVRDLHRVKGSNAVLVDVSEVIVSNILENLGKSKFEIETIQGNIPDSVRDFFDERQSKGYGSSPYGGGGGRYSGRSSGGSSSYSGGGYGGGGSYGSSRPGRNFGKGNDDGGRKSDSYGGSRGGDRNRVGRY